MQFRHGLATLALLLPLVACSDPSASPGTPSPSPTATPTASPTAPPPRPQALVVEEMHGVRGLWSVVVRNPNRDVGLLQQGFRILARTDKGRILVFGDRIPPNTPPTCCTIAALPPDGTYGLFFDLLGDRSDVVSVEVQLRAGGWKAWSPGLRPLVVGKPGKALPRVLPVSRKDPRGGTRVVVSVSQPGKQPVDAVAQPVLQTPDGRLIAVIAAQVQCVSSAPRELVLELPVAVPPGTRVREVLAYAQPKGDEAKRC